MAGEKRVALFPGSFDPPTSGHLDVIERAAGLFDEVVVAVGVAHGKKSLFTDDERVDLIGKMTGHLSNVSAAKYDGLTVTAAKEAKARVIVRGVRHGSDCDYEIQMALMNRDLAHDVDTIFLPTSPAKSHISSTLVKEIAKYGGDIRGLVPKELVEPLLAKYK